MGISQSITTTEECDNCSTPAITRILPKKFDPRSPTEGIVRTPIEVTCTPKNKEINVKTSQLSDSPKNMKYEKCENRVIRKVDFDEQETGNSSQIHSEINEVMRSEENNTVLNIIDRDKIYNNNHGVFYDCNDAEELKNIKADEDGNASHEKKMYLETDIDAVNDSFINNLHLEHPRIKQLKKNKNVSPVSMEGTTSFKNVENNDISIAKISIQSLADESVDDPSVVVSDNEEILSLRSVCKPNVQEWLIAIEDDCDSFMPFDIPPDDNNKLDKAEICGKTDNSLLNFEKNNLITTPDRKRNPAPIERTPLSCLIQNKIFEPLKEGSNLKKKQWRGIQEERERRGLTLGDENTPPLPPPMDKVSSAPGKLIRRRNIIDWDDENVTLLI
ncbi:uncharacterized protein LOC142319610 [Lycorma delicatula]|uniref:uncharacterized protein LOC142319610 n=1 Tax=Lycorma delicatula TaxID=130591 RepID=UPI003F517717